MAAVYNRKKNEKYVMRFLKTLAKKGYFIGRLTHRKL